MDIRVDGEIVVMSLILVVNLPAVMIQSFSYTSETIVKSDQLVFYPSLEL